jgi:spore germination protein KA
MKDISNVAVKEVIEDNLAKVNEIFNAPTNSDLHTQAITIHSLNCKGSIVYLFGATNVESVRKDLLIPLLTEQHKIEPNLDKLDFLMCNIIPLSSKKSQNFKEITEGIISGKTVLFVEGESNALVIETTGFEGRSIEKPQNENVIKGPKEAFVESGSKNASLIRKQLKDENLISEKIVLGNRDNNNFNLMYIKNITDQELVNRVKKRMDDIDIDSVPQLSFLEQHLEEKSYSLVPCCLLTERPDRACAFLREGHIIILSDNSPYALVTPITFWSLFHTAEDYYERWAYGNFIRIVRMFSILVALLTPAIFIAATNYHFEMIQTDLLLAMAANRETVPFPGIAEVLLMEITFELLREAGIRIPTAIGPTIGIVGALILGQAAVDANIVSPILVVIVAITGLASFAIPEISFSFMIRILRFGFLMAGAVMGFYGIAIMLVMCVAYLASHKSFGVPFLSPLAPYYPSSKDLIVRPPLWKLWLRPLNMSPKVPKRGKKP